MELRNEPLTRYGRGRELANPRVVPSSDTAREAISIWLHPATIEKNAGALQLDRARERVRQSA